MAILAALLTVTGTGVALAASLVWTRTYNGAANGTDVGEAVAVAADGNIYVAGATGTAAQGDNLLLRKYSPSGGTLWFRAFNGTANGDDVGKGVAVGPDNGVYIAGSTIVTGQEQNLLLRKYSPAGGLLWNRTYNGPDNLQDSGRAVAVGANGSVYVAGSTDTLSQQSNVILIKYTSSGARAWVRAYNSAGNGSDVAYDVAVATDGNVYVVGYTVGASGGDLLVLKYSPAGALRWSRTYNRTGTRWDEGSGVAVDGNGAVYVTGYSDTAMRSKDLFLRKYSSSGAVLWTRFYNHPQNGWDWGTGVAVSGDHSVSVTGSTGLGSDGNLLLLRYSTSGVRLDKRIYAGASGSDDWGLGVAAGEGSRVYVTGHVRTAAQGYNLLLQRYQWSR